MNPRGPASPLLRTFAIFAACALPACKTAGPQYVRPTVSTPSAFRDAAATAKAGAVADLPWWSVFKDDALAALLREAVGNNQDLAIAMARVDAARAGTGIARSDRMPQVEGTADASHERASREIQSSGKRTNDDFRAAIGASWELDLWGRIRRGEEAAFADYVASEEGRRAVLVTLVGDVAEAYFDLRELDLELEITRATIDTRKKTNDLFGQRLNEGLASKLETSQASADLATAAAAAPALERLITQKENEIRFLLGSNPGPVARGASLTGLVPPPELPTGLPSTLLERRPDVRSAEAGVVAANARIGVADAAFFPTVSLSAILGLESHDLLTDLSSGSAAFGAIGGSLVAPIFTGGRLTAERCLAVARWEEAVAQYRKAAQSAFRDVADQLVTVRRSREVRTELEKVVASLSEALSLASTRYEGGLSTYFEVLDAQRRLFPAQIELARTKRDQYVAVVRLYRALGGGWQTPPLAACAPPR